MIGTRLQRGRQILPVLGYVSRVVDESFWRIERAGRILPVSYQSATEAAQALIDLVEVS